ncbi:MAG TPA: DUF2057 domain-containing protein [Pseudomonas xinjiangensis]|uniref:DUF2057 domain-containing protein n=2 Tax=root TaxID=1 RepID=A0A7V1BQM8_9GAMM|nr:DUF2057 domain-containing protein [Halopseudomonas xinjiangensis]HEC49336.1 DUF2057 domain-containing protein [Halopseudomonas xinjiangensis]
MRIIVSIALACLLSACAQQSQVQLYPGAELPANQVLTVQVPAALEIADLNGQEVPSANFLFSGDKRILKLEPGEYRLNAFYKNVYDIGGGISSEVVRTRSAIFIIDGNAGETWRLGYPAPENLEQARELKETFNGWSENLATGERVASQAGQQPQSSLNQLLGNSAAETSSAATTVAPLESSQAAPVAAPLPALAASTSKAALPHNDATLATLQQLWQMLTPESREAFLEWVQQ